VVIVGFISGELASDSLLSGLAAIPFPQPTLVAIKRSGPQAKDLPHLLDKRKVQEASSDAVSVLILEDRESDFLLITRELKRAGFGIHVQRAETEEQFRAELRPGLGIILSDYVLGLGFNALTALEILQESGLDIPLIVLTGAVNEETVVECMKRGAADYLFKDRLIRLGPAVRRALEESESRRQKRRAETALRKTSELLQHLVETIRVIPWELDLETWSFTYVGPQAVSLVGYPLEDWLRKGFWDERIRLEDPEALYRLCAGSEAGDHDFDCQMTSCNGPIVHLHCAAKTTFCDGRARSLHGFMMDITELKLTQESLARHSADLAASNAELQQFAYVASHDLREPLRMVSFYTQLLAKRYRGKLDSDADEFIGYAQEGAVRMGELIQNLLDYSRISSWKRETAPTDCEAVFRKSIENLRISITESGATVDNDPLPVVTGDVSQLGQLFQNLIGNALKYRSSARPPHIHVSAREEQAEWLFSVCDNGIGIEPQYFETIFGIFQQLHSREQYGGTGVGLAICRRIVERHRGRIWVESEPDKGATFCFTIPKQQQSED
jgi:nitrogen-specific signal transduction histidine kinase/FixJ family two-component response regulator